MKNRNIKIVSIVIVALMVLMLTMSFIYATSIGDVTIDPTLDSDPAKKVTKAGNIALGIIQVGGTAIAVGMLLVLGIKYVIAAPSEKADIKKSSVMYIIGAVILFAAANLTSIIYDVAQQAFKQGAQ